MKMMSCLTALLFTGVCSVSVVNAADPQLDKAVALSAPDSSASLSAICQAVYEAAKVEEAKPEEVFESVLSQRTTWKASECYAIFRAILLARPDLAGNLNNYVASYKGGKNGKEEISGESVSNLDPTLYRMLTALYQATLADGVAEETVNMLMSTITGVYDGAYEQSIHDIGINTNGRIYLYPEVIPTPPPVSNDAAVSGR